MYLNYINNLRGLAIILIIAWHCMGIVDKYVSKFIYDIIAVILRDSTIVFVFISGFLFQHLSENYNFKGYMKAKFKNVLLPYLFVSIPAVIYMVFMSDMFVNIRIEDIPSFLKDVYINFPHTSEIIYLYLTGGYHLGPLWFIPMIFLFYIISPLLIKFDKPYFYYILPLLLIIPMTVSRGIYVLDNFLYFLPVYIYGMFFSKNKDSLLNLIQRNVLFLSLLILFFSTVSFLYRYADYFSFLNHDVFIFWQKLLIASLLTYTFYRYDHILGKKFNFFANVSFGLFFIHQYIILILMKFLKLSDLTNIYLIFIFILTIIFVISLASILLIISKKIFKKNSRLLVGY